MGRVYSIVLYDETRQDTVRNKVLDQLKEDLELEGFDPDSPAFAAHLLARQVKKCQELQQVRDCPQCQAFDDCDISKRYLMQLRFGTSKEKT